MNQQQATVNERANALVKAQSDALKARLDHLEAQLVPNGMVEEDHPRIKAYDSLRFHVGMFVEDVEFLTEYAGPLKQIHECVHSACAECIVTDVEEAAEVAMLERYLVHVDDMVGHVVHALRQVHDHIEKVKEASPFTATSAAKAGAR
jgi:hypothetical protein